jgi:hypothetical protein
MSAGRAAFAAWWAFARQRVLSIGVHYAVLQGNIIHLGHFCATYPGEAAAALRATSTQTTW